MELTREETKALVDFARIHADKTSCAAYRTLADKLEKAFHDKELVCTPPKLFTVYQVSVQTGADSFLSKYVATPKEAGELYAQYAAMCEEEPEGHDPVLPHTKVFYLRTSNNRDLIAFLNRNFT